MSVRFMITGVPSRNASPILRASLYERGWIVVMRRSSPATGVCGAACVGSVVRVGRCSGVTWASYSVGTVTSPSS